MLSVKFVSKDYTKVVFSFGDTFYILLLEGMNFCISSSAQGHSLSSSQFRDIYDYAQFHGIKNNAMASLRSIA